MHKNEIIPGAVVSLDTGRFEDQGKFIIRECSFTPESTATRLKLENIKTGEVTTRVVASHQIYSVNSVYEG